MYSHWVEERSEGRQIKIAEYICQLKTNQRNVSDHDIFFCNDVKRLCLHICLINCQLIYKTNFTPQIMVNAMCYVNTSILDVGHLPNESEISTSTLVLTFITISMPYRSLR